MERLDADGCAQVDAVLQTWRQGDCVVGEQWFAFRTHLELPLTEDGAVASAGGVDIAESAVFGFMVLTQTCDLVRKSSMRPFIEVCPLVKVDEGQHREIERGRRPNYAFVPALADQHLVGDLDRVMTIEKSVVAGWDRVEGCQGDAEARRLARTLARKRERFAFPDDFVEFAAPLMSRMSSKHNKRSDEGRALRALREIRVRAVPSWDADEVRLAFWFIRDADDLGFENRYWDQFIGEWEQRIARKGRFVDIQTMLLTLDDLSAREYLESDPLDLDHLSSGTG